MDCFQMVWKPGESGNPLGRAITKPIDDAIRQEFAMVADGRVDPVPKTSLRMTVRKQMEKAAKGSLASLAWLAERTEGKARQVISGDASDPIAVTISRGADATAMIERELARIASRQAAIEGEAVEAGDENQ